MEAVVIPITEGSSTLQLYEHLEKAIKQFPPTKVNYLCNYTYHKNEQLHLIISAETNLSDDAIEEILDNFYEEGLKKVPLTHEEISILIHAVNSYHYHYSSEYNEVKDLLAKLKDPLYHNTTCSEGIIGIKKQKRVISNFKFRLKDANGSPKPEYILKAFLKGFPELEIELNKVYEEYKINNLL